MANNIIPFFLLPFAFLGGPGNDAIQRMNEPASRDVINFIFCFALLIASPFARSLYSDVVECFIQFVVLEDFVAIELACLTCKANVNGVQAILRTNQRPHGVYVQFVF
jgi:hypothetical protein